MDITYTIPAKYVHIGFKGEKHEQELNFRPVSVVLLLISSSYLMWVSCDGLSFMERKCYGVCCCCCMNVTFNR